ncbi:hypothetical protein POVWA2_006800 [Plasmodium ovale wallikeri]|uniref:Uncharacterized protein n=1 Tax=Plasmodium ovale wallikeri TaxID=864142 RepID=A0A1A8YKL6_PLAOA|nr:hypothetical protein POVWA2_006800 [Plasmodium ovale wallikeri]
MDARGCTWMQTKPTIIDINSAFVDILCEGPLGNPLYKLREGDSPSIGNITSYILQNYFKGELHKWYVKQIFRRFSIRQMVKENIKYKKLHLTVQL